MIYQHLFDQVREPETVRAGLIGVGSFGLPIVTQAPSIPRLDIPVVADIDLSRALEALRLAGYADDQIAICDSRQAALAALELGQRVAMQDAMLMMDLPLDVIATATRSPYDGAAYALEAIHQGKHVVMIDKEADSVVGAILKSQADSARVVYTSDDGDEPSLVMGLVSWARSLGFEVLCAGNLHSCFYESATGTYTSRGRPVRVSEEERWAMTRIPAGQTLRYTAARRELFRSWRIDEECGDPLAHLTVLANGTGLLPDRPVGHRPVLRLVEMPEVLCPVEAGGVLERRGAVDMPTIIYGRDEPYPGGGIFVTVANSDPTSCRMMVEKGAIANKSGTVLMLQRPFHLCGAETAMSILCAGLLGVPTGAAEIVQHIDIVATARRDFKAGEVLGSGETLGWDRDLGGQMVSAVPMIAENPVPFFALQGSRLVRDVPTGAKFTLDMIAPREDTALWQLRRELDLTLKQN